MKIIKRFHRDQNFQNLHKVFQLVSHIMSRVNELASSLCKKQQRTLEQNLRNYEVSSASSLHLPLTSIELECS